MNKTGLFAKHFKMPYTIFYQDCGEYVAWKSDTKSVVEVKSLDMNYKNYEMVKCNIKASKTSIFEYVRLFHQWVKELKTGTVPINWFSYKDNSQATIFTFKRLSGNVIDSHEPIGRVEGAWMNKCNKASIRTLDERYINRPVMTFAYDFTFCHPYALANKSLMIPTKAGEEHTLTELPKMSEVKVGYYRVMIKSNNKHFQKLFSFSKFHVYPDQSLKQAMYHKVEFGVSIELFQDGQPNAYLYKDEDLVTGKSIFQKWNRTLWKLKKKYPQNPLVKFLGSSLSGQLSKHNTIWKTMKEIEEMDDEEGENYDIKAEVTDNHGFPIKMKVVDVNKPYRYSIRHKPFLLALVRNQVAKVAYKDYKNCVRVFEDCVQFTHPVDLSTVKFIKPEDKTTGVMKYINAYRPDKDHERFIEFVKSKHPDLYKAICENHLSLSKLKRA